jgi:hypothetical protein
MPRTKARFEPNELKKREFQQARGRRSDDDYQRRNAEESKCQRNTNRAQRTRNRRLRQTKAKPVNGEVGETSTAVEKSDDAAGFIDGVSEVERWKSSEASRR